MSTLSGAYQPTNVRFGFCLPECIAKGALLDTERALFDRRKALSPTTKARALSGHENACFWAPCLSMADLFQVPR